MEFKVKQSTLEKVFQYLTERPFKEVNTLLQELQQSIPINEDNAEEIEVEGAKEVAPRRTKEKSGK